MKKFMYLGAIASFFLIVSCESGLQTTGNLELRTEQDSLSYAYGVMSIVGKGGMEELGIKINADKYEDGYNFVTSRAEDEYDVNELIKPILAMSEEISQRQNQPFTKEDQPFTNIDEFSYAFGAYNASAYVGCNYEVNGAAMCAGMRDAYSGEEKIEEGIVAKMADMFTVGLRNAQMAEIAKDGEDNKAKGEAFLEENMTKDGVKVTSSGLQYKVLTSGTGTRKPTVTDEVVVHYEGRFIEGGIFDSSLGRDPVEFGLSRVIPGWTEGLQLMREGDKFQFYIPSELAYGERGMGRDIGAHETLLFDVELIEIK